VLQISKISLITKKKTAEKRLASFHKHLLYRKRAIKILLVSKLSFQNILFSKENFGILIDPSVYLEKLFSLEALLCRLIKLSTKRSKIKDENFWVISSSRIKITNFSRHEVGEITST
jgi:hypothetical protein